MKVSPAEISYILNEKDVLIMLDGYDEYTPGTNESIDDLLPFGRGDNNLVLVSSRSGSFLNLLRYNAHEELSITGFSGENIIKCAGQYLSDPDKCTDFLDQAESVGLHDKKDPSEFRYTGALHVPILLLMSCAVYNKNDSLPSSKTGLFEKIVDMSISRTTLKMKCLQKSATEIPNLQELKVKLGALAWAALNKDKQQLLLNKVSFFISS